MKPLFLLIAIAASLLVVSQAEAHHGLAVVAPVRARVVQPVVQTRVRRGLFGGTVVRQRVRNVAVAPVVAAPIVVRQHFVRQPVIAFTAPAYVAPVAAPVILRQNVGGCAAFFAY